MLFGLTIEHYDVFLNNLQSKMSKIGKEEKRVDDGSTPEQNRFAVVFMDNLTGVQIAAATEDINKLVKTDLMKMVKAFKDGVKKEEKALETWKSNEPKTKSK